MSYLRRLEAGPFSVADALLLPVIERASAAGGLADLLLAPDAGLGMPRLTVIEEEKVRLGTGKISVTAAPSQPMIRPFPTPAVRTIGNGLDSQPPMIVAAASWGLHAHARLMGAETAQYGKPKSGLPNNLGVFRNPLPVLSCPPPLETNAHSG